jgi:hypothetical protein
MTMRGAARVIAGHLAVAAGGVTAMASPGCDKVNDGGFNGRLWATQPFKATISGFAPGDTVSISTSNVKRAVMTFRTGTGTVLKTVWDNKTITYTVTGLNDDTTLTFSTMNLADYRTDEFGSARGECRPAGTEAK